MLQRPGARLVVQARTLSCEQAAHLHALARPAGGDHELGHDKDAGEAALGVEAEEGRIRTDAQERWRRPGLRARLGCEDLAASRLIVCWHGMHLQHAGAEVLHKQPRAARDCEATSVRVQVETIDELLLAAMQKIRLCALHRVADTGAAGSDEEFGDDEDGNPHGDQSCSPFYTDFLFWVHKVCCFFLLDFIVHKLDAARKARKARRCRRRDAACSMQIFHLLCPHHGANLR